jgi:hypothetical protein
MRNVLIGMNSLCSSGGALLSGERSAHANAGGEQCSLYLLGREVEQASDASGVVAFHIPKQEDHPLIRRQFAESLFHLGAFDVAPGDAETGFGLGWLGLFVEGHPLTQLADQRAVDTVAVRFFSLAEGTEKSFLRHLIRFNLIADHIVGEGVGPMLMGLVDVALAVLNRPLGHLALHDTARTLGRKLFFKVQQSVPQLKAPMLHSQANVAKQADVRMAVHSTSVKRLCEISGIRRSSATLV